MKNRLSELQDRIDDQVKKVESTQAALLMELMQELRLVTEENSKLRKSLVKSTQKADPMSSKLRNALYE